MLALGVCCGGPSPPVCSTGGWGALVTPRLAVSGGNCPCVVDKGVKRRYPAQSQQAGPTEAVAAIVSQLVERAL